MKTNIIISLSLLLLWSVKLAGQDTGSVARQIMEARESSLPFSEWTSVLQPEVAPPAGARVSETVKEASYFSYDTQVAEELLSSRPAQLSLQLPLLEGKTQWLDLVEVPDSFYDYIVRASSGEVYYGSPEDGLHYRGVVRGMEEQTLIAVSFFEGEMTGLVYTDQGNFTLGKIEGSESHILYNDQNAEGPAFPGCDTPDDTSVTYGNDVLAGAFAADAGSKIVKLYLETEYDIYTTAGGDITLVRNYITGLFNQVATLYQNEGITTELSELAVWVSPDPYTATSTSSLLAQFQAAKSSINGDLGQLLTFRSVGGGIAAGFDGICNANVDNSLSVSAIHTSYNNVPTYSWSVYVVTHEYGHLFGSRHTHACVWNGNGTAIDGCSGFTEGSCSLPGLPAGGGTIMSYCHTRPVGINFSRGFGTQPGNVIRNSVANGSCLETDCQDNLTITANVLSGTDQQEADLTITATNVIASAATAIYHAGNAVTMSSGFHAQNGSVFRAYNEGCTGNFTAITRASEATVAAVRGIEAAEALAGAPASATGLILYPNPADGTLSVRLGKGDAYSVSVYDDKGTRLLTGDLTTSEEFVDVSSLPNGSYFIVVTNNETRQTEKGKFMISR